MATWAAHQPGFYGWKLVRNNYLLGGKLGCVESEHLGLLSLLDVWQEHETGTERLSLLRRARQKPENSIKLCLPGKLAELILLHLKMMDLSWPWAVKSWCSMFCLHLLHIGETEENNGSWAIIGELKGTAHLKMRNPVIVCRTMDIHNKFLRQQNFSVTAKKKLAAGCFYFFQTLALFVLSLRKYDHIAPYWSFIHCFFFRCQWV